MPVLLSIVQYLSASILVLFPRRFRCSPSIVRTIMPGLT